MFAMFSSPSRAISHITFVNSDFDALALHMRDCERAHGRLFSVRSGLQRARAVAAGRIVTIACLAVVIGVGLFALA